MAIVVDYTGNPQTSTLLSENLLSSVDSERENTPSFPALPVNGAVSRQRKNHSLLGMLLNNLMALGSALVPSFMGKNTRRRLYSTSYLDGLRGVAAFIVFIDHFAVNYFDLLRRGYGSTADDFYLIQIPLVRLFYSGRASVAIFFVISGFVLSYKPLKQVHTGQSSLLLDTLASSVFRRGLRLYIPVAVGTFLSMLMSHWEWYQELPSTSTDALPPIIDNFWDQLEHWRDHMVGISWPFQTAMPNTPYCPPYNGHLWTIPIEYFGSMVVYVMMLGLGRCQTWIRLSTMGVTAVATCHYERWDLFLFISGMLLAELSIIKTITNVSFGFPGEKFTWLQKLLIPSKRLRSAYTTTNYILCFASLYLLSYPGGSYMDYEPGPGIWHEFLMSWTPSRYTELWYGYERFWISVGGVILVFTISNSALLQKPFTTGVAQYLGDISYALYIVHGPILFSFGAWFMNKYGNEDDGWSYGGAFAIAAILNTVLCVWMADLFWRFVDAKSVLLAKRCAEESWRKEG